MTLDELAVGLRRSKTTVASWVAQGVIPRDGTLLECALSAMDYFAEVKAGRRGRPTEPGAEVLDLAAERARLAREQANGHEMKNAELRGELIPRDEVKSIWARRALSWKERIRSVPVVALSRVSGLTKKQARAIGDLIDEALVELADGSSGGIRAARKRGRKAGARDRGAASATSEAHGERVG